MEMEQNLYIYIFQWNAWKMKRCLKKAGKNEFTAFSLKVKKYKNVLQEWQQVKK